MIIEEIQFGGCIVLNLNNTKVASRIAQLGKNFLTAAKLVKLGNTGYALERVVNDPYIVNNLDQLNISIGLCVKVGGGVTTLTVYVHCFTDKEAQIEYLYLLGGELNESLITVQTFDPPEWVDYEVLDMIDALLELTKIAIAA